MTDNMGLGGSMILVEQRNLLNTCKLRSKPAVLAMQGFESSS